MLDYLIVVSVIAAAFATTAAYYVGRAEGFDAGYRKGEVLNIDSGWEDEAQWWRRNAISICPREARSNDA